MYILHTPLHMLFNSPSPMALLKSAFLLFHKGEKIKCVSYLLVGKLWHSEGK